MPVRACEEERNTCLALFCAPCRPAPPPPSCAAARPGRPPARAAAPCWRCKTRLRFGRLQFPSWRGHAAGRQAVAGRGGGRARCGDSSCEPVRHNCGGEKVTGVSTCPPAVHCTVQQLYGGHRRGDRIPVAHSTLSIHELIFGCNTYLFNSKYLQNKSGTSVRYSNQLPCL